MYVCVPVSECVPMSTRALQDQRGIGSPGFGVIGGCELPDWMPGTQLVFSARAVYAFNCWPSLQPPEGGFLFPLKLPLKVKGKILNVFSQTLKSAHDTPIPATDILWFNSRSCCSRLPYTPQFISLYSGLGFAAGSPVPPSSSASLQGWAVCPTILLTQSSNPWGVISVVSFVQPSASEPQKFP